MNIANIKATGNSRKEIHIKMSAKINSDSTSSGLDIESDDGESEEVEDSVEEPKEETGAHGSFGSDQVGHPEASPVHLLPTPPPDSGAKMVARRTTLRSEILSAIDGLGNRTGSSVQAIVKYMKNNGHEVTDQRRFSVQVRRSLKMSIQNGQVEQVKQSFKLTKNFNNKRKSLEKLKDNKIKAKEKAKEKESKAKEKAKEKESKAKEKAKEKERKAKEKAKEKESKAKKKAEQEESKVKAKKEAKGAKVNATKEKTSKKAPKKGTTGKAVASAQPMAKKPKANAVKQLVAGQGKNLLTEDLGESTDGYLSEAQATSTPKMVGKGRATRKRK